MTRIGLFHDTGTGDRGSVYLLDTYNYDGDVNKLNETALTVVYQIPFHPGIMEGAFAEDSFYILTESEFEQEQQAEEQRIFSYDAEERMYDDDAAHDLPTSVDDAAVIVLDALIAQMNDLTGHDATNTLNTGEKIRDAIDAYESDEADKDVARITEAETKSGIAVGDSVYRVGVWSHQLAEGKLRTFADERSNKLFTYTGEDDAEDYIKADQIDIKVAKKALEIFPLPSDYEYSKWYGRFKNNRKIEITGNKQSEIVIRAAVIIAAQERLNARQSK